MSRKSNPTSIERRGDQEEAEAEEQPAEIGAALARGEESFADRVEGEPSALRVEVLSASNRRSRSAASSRRFARRRRDANRRDRAVATAEELPAGREVDVGHRRRPVSSPVAVVNVAGFDLLADLAVGQLRRSVPVAQIRALIGQALHDRA